MSNSIKNTNIYETVYEFYKKKGYFDKYTGSIAISIIIIIVFFVAISYLFILVNLNYYKKNWVQERCNPVVMPFAGLINTPSNMSMLDFTVVNFSYCLNTILEDIVTFALAPIIFALEIIVMVYDEILMALDSITKIFTFIRMQTALIMTDILGGIMNYLVPFQLMIIKSRVMMEKSYASLQAGFYTIIGTYYTMVTGIRASYGVGVIISYILAAMAAGLFIAAGVAFGIPFGLGVPAGIVLTIGGMVDVGFLIFSIIMVVMIGYGFLLPILGLFPSPLPGVPSSCFSGNTKVKLCNGSKIENVKFKDIQPGMKLKDNSIVTSVFKHNTGDAKMYKLDNIYVTGEHRVLYKNNWIASENHPNAILLKEDEFNEPYLYCLNTTNKTITIDSHKFKDWDDMHKKEYGILEKKFNLEIKKDNIFETFENGFHEDFEISLYDGSKKHIKDIKVNDILKNGITVTGTVKIQNNLPVYQFLEFIATPGCLLKRNNKIYPVKNGLLGYKLIETTNNNDNIYGNYLYHIVTDKGIFEAYDLEFLHYGYNLDIFL